MTQQTVRKDDIIINHFRIVKDSNKKEIKEAMKRLQTSEKDPEDFKIFVSTHQIRVNKIPVEATGGVTTCTSRSKSHKSFALCGMREHYCRKIGRRIAEGRFEKITSKSAE